MGTPANYKYNPRKRSRRIKIKRREKNVSFYLLLKMLYLIKIEFESSTINFEKAIIFHNQYTNRSICGHIPDESGNRLFFYVCN